MYTEFEKLAGVNSPMAQAEFYEMVKQAAYADMLIKLAEDVGDTITPADVGVTADDLAQAAIVDATNKALQQQGVDPDQVVDQVAQNIAQDPNATAALLNAKPSDVDDLANNVVAAVAQNTQG